MVMQFIPRIKLVASPSPISLWPALIEIAGRTIDVTLDPRIRFTAKGRELFEDKASHLYTLLTVPGMRVTATKYVEYIQWIYDQNELELVNVYPALPKPQWDHDCDACVFLGTVENSDLYYCSATKSLVGRFGPGGSQHASGTGLVDDTIHLAANSFEGRVASGMSGSVISDRVWSSCVLAESRGLIQPSKEQHTLVIRGQE